MLKSLLVTGRCPYNLYQESSLREAGVDAEIFMNWGIYLPEHVDEILAKEPGIIHLQWPESLAGMRPAEEIDLVEFAECLTRLKSRGAKLFWAMHNLLPHDRGKAEFWHELYQVFADHCDVCCHHSEVGREQVLRTYRFEKSRHVILRHGYFEHDVHPPVERALAREQLGLPQDATIYLNVGALRPDKKTSELIECFAKRDHEKEFMVFAGGAGSDYGKAMLERAEAVPNVIIHNGYIPNETVSLLANAADAFLFLHGENHLTSGGPHLSQAHLLPQITVDYPYAREVLGDLAVYIPPEGDRSAALARVLDDLDPTKLRHLRDLLKYQREPWDWSRIGQQTRQAYETSLNS